MERPNAGFHRVCRWLQMRYCSGSAYALGGQWKLITQHMALWVSSAYMSISFSGQMLVGTGRIPCSYVHKNKSICTKRTQIPWHGHIRTLTHARNCCYSSAVLWALRTLWRYEGKEALEAPTSLLPNGRIDIYPGRLWAVAAAPTEMIQAATRHTEGSLVMDENGSGGGPGDVWGLCVHTVP